MRDADRSSAAAAPARALLLDLDGVLRIWDPDNDRRAEEAADLPPGALRRAAFARDLLQPAITGQVADEVWRGRVADRLRADFPDAAAERAVEMWSAPAGAVDREVLALVRACRRRVRVVLVTNATTRLPADLRRLGLDGELDAVVNSADMGAAKPAEAIFRAALGAARADPAQALFVDDTPENIAAAEALGIPAHLYRGAGMLRGEMCRHGLLPPTGRAEPPPP